MMYDDTIAEILYARTCDTAENAKMIRGIICQNSVTNVGSTLKKVRQMFIRCQKIGIGPYNASENGTGKTSAR